MPRLTFRGAFIRHMDIRHEEAGLTTRLHVSANYTDRIAEAMDWPKEPDDSIDSGKLSGELILNNFILTPNGVDELKRYEIDIPARDATAFQFVRVREGDESEKLELRFVVRSADVKAPMQIANYMSKLGRAPAAMKVDCAKQDELPLEAGAEEEPESEEGPRGPALASRREMRQREAERTN